MIMNPETQKAIAELRFSFNENSSGVRSVFVKQVRSVIAALETAERERDEARAMCGELRNIIRDFKVAVAFVTSMRPGSENAFVGPIARADKSYDVGRGWVSPESRRKIEAACAEMRDLIIEWRNEIDDYHRKYKLSGYQDLQLGRIQHALSTDCGKELLAERERYRNLLHASEVLLGHGNFVHGRARDAAALICEIREALKPKGETK